MTAWLTSLADRVLMSELIVILVIRVFCTVIISSCVL